MRRADPSCLPGGSWSREAFGNTYSSRCIMRACVLIVIYTDTRIQGGSVGGHYHSTVSHSSYSSCIRAGTRESASKQVWPLPSHLLAAAKVLLAETTVRARRPAGEGCDRSGGGIVVMICRIGEALCPRTHARTHARAHARTHTIGIRCVISTGQNIYTTQWSADHRTCDIDIRVYVRYTHTYHIDITYISYSPWRCGQT